jgi:hypothetical protein
VFTVELRRRSGMPSSRPKVWVAQHATFFGAGYLHRTPADHRRSATRDATRGLFGSNFDSRSHYESLSEKPCAITLSPQQEP